MIADFIEEDKFYLKTICLLFASLYYALFLLEVFIEYGLFVNIPFSIIAIGVMLYYAYGFTDLLEKSDESLYQLEYQYDYNFFISLFLAALLAITTVFEVTHILDMFLVSFYLFPLRLLMIISVFRYMLQRNLLHKSYFDTSEIVDFIPDCKPFSLLQCLFMIILLLFSNAYLTFIVYCIISLSLFSNFDFKPIAFLLIALLFIYTPAVNAFLLLLFNIFLLCCIYLKTGSDCLHIFLNISQNLHLIASFVHSAIEALYPTVGLTRIINLPPILFAIIYSLCFFAKSWNLHQKPLDILYGSTVSQNIYYNNLKFDLETLNKLFRGFCHGFSDCHEFEHLSHHNVPFISSVVVFSSSMLTSLSNLCCTDVSCPKNQQKPQFCQLVTKTYGD